MPSLKRALRVVVPLIATLLPAQAEVNNIDPAAVAVEADPAGLAVGADFVSPPNDRAVYFSPGGSVHPSDSILGKMFDWTGLQIWLVFLRDAYLPESTDYLSNNLTNLDLSPPLYLINVSQAVRVIRSCRNFPISTQARCEIERDLLSAGWTNPDSYSGVLSGRVLQRPIGSGMVQPTAGHRTSVSELQTLREALQSLAQVDLPNGAECCDAFPMNDSFSPPDSIPQWSNGVTTSSQGESPMVSSQIDQMVSPQIDQISGTIPEPSIPLMLLIGASALAYVARKQTFSKMTSQPRPPSTGTA